MNQERLGRFGDTMRAALIECRQTKPEVYRWPAEQADSIAGKIIATVAAGKIRTTIIDGPAWKITAKRLGIKPTYKAFDALLNGGAA